MIARVLATLGVDAVQWRALVAAYLRMDLRRAGGPRRQDGGGDHGALAYSGLLFITALNGVVLAVLTVALRDTFTAAVIVTTYAALNTSLLLLVDFTGLVVSPDDYRILGSRPVNSRTYFAARLASVLVYVSTMAAVMALPPAGAFAFGHRLGLVGFAAAFIATMLCCVCAAIVLIQGYASLMSRIHPRRLTRALTYLQLLSSASFLGGYYLVSLATQKAWLANASIRDAAFVWVIPSAWFAAIVPAAGGRAGQAEWIAAVAALGVTLACVPLAAGRMSLDYAERLSELASVSEPPASRRLRSLPGFGQGEAHAVATLVRAQFRYDSRFRLAILSIAPLTAFYVLLGLDEGSLMDPFMAAPTGVNSTLYFALVFLPMTLHSALMTSESWRAAWIFFATPADPARLIVGAKNFVAVFFLGGYVTLLAALWSAFYERVWHAVLHAAILGMFAHLLLQAAAIVHPALPFATEPRKAERSGELLVLFLVAATLSAFLPLMLPSLYARFESTAALVAVLVGVTAGLEYALRLRAREVVLDLEFQS